jgi:hypothetical protein
MFKEFKKESFHPAKVNKHVTEEYTASTSIKVTFNWRTKAKSKNARLLYKHGSHYWMSCILFVTMFPHS